MRIINDKLDLLKEDIICENFKIFHLEKDLSNYVVNIICCQFNSQDDLKNYWREVVNNVAMYIQSSLNKNIELFNVYILFFVEKVDENLIYIIEQDKYSSRKIVINKKIPIDIQRLENIVDDKLFEFVTDKIENKNILDNYLKKYNKKFYTFIKDIKGKEVENLDNAIEILKL
ncbi:TPA: hypothetical protein PTV42_003357 [Clostridium botulinum]|uniref:ABC-three component system middle component 1 n=2 Tax=Clostridium botulinum TaxID=1491 RepID=UPI0011809ABC|nr:ABC-three component system middle component 1 [Clostridium botulinum]MBY6795625.1 hypothetical protein [Clostridium botulinum]MBY6865444.1 hypothetical protein [Clostridium botulinum]MBY6871863.1 hypothetical protein [Clostridium botulinum]MBY6888133.1 hypothetical protein [Clostridium botulinum]NFI44692.1 hypothetical protein [Clostridium botulinum]